MPNNSGADIMREIALWDPPPPFLSLSAQGVPEQHARPVFLFFFLVFFLAEPGRLGDVTSVFGALLSSPLFFFPPLSLCATRKPPLSLFLFFFFPDSSLFSFIRRRGGGGERIAPFPFPSAEGKRACLSRVRKERERLSSPPSFSSPPRSEE